MTTNFPTSLDSLTNPVGTDPTTNPDHAAQHANANDAIEALETKVGINGSTVVSSMDLRSRSRSQKTSTSSFNNSSAENTLYSFSIPQNEPKAGDLYRMTLWGMILNNQAGSSSLTWRFKFGSTTMMTGLMSYTQSASERVHKIVFELLFTATNAERAMAVILGSATGQDGTDAIALFGSSETGLGLGSASVDSTAAAQAMAVTAQLGVASVNYTVDARAGIVERIAA